MQWLIKFSREQSWLLGIGLKPPKAIGLLKSAVLGYVQLTLWLNLQKQYALLESETLQNHVFYFFLRTFQNDAQVEISKEQRRVEEAVSWLEHLYFWAEGSRGRPRFRFVSVLWGGHPGRGRTLLSGGTEGCDGTGGP